MSVGRCRYIKLYRSPIGPFGELRSDVSLADPTHDSSLDIVRDRRRQKMRTLRPVKLGT